MSASRYILNYRLIQDERAATASIVTYLPPIVAVALGGIVLGEAVTWNLFAGTAIVLAALAFSDRRRAQATGTSAPTREPPPIPR